MSQAGTNPSEIQGFKVNMGYTDPQLEMYVDAIDYSWIDLSNLPYFFGRNTYWRKWWRIESKSPYISNSINQQLSTGSWNSYVLDFSAPEDVEEGTVSFSPSAITGIGFVFTGGSGEDLNIEFARLSFEYPYTATGSDLLIC